MTRVSRLRALSVIKAALDEARTPTMALQDAGDGALRLVGFADGNPVAVTLMESADVKELLGFKRALEREATASRVLKKLEEEGLLEG